MRITQLREPDELVWLQDVHGIPTDSKCAIAYLYGNEDAPEKVEVYAEDDYRCKPVVYRLNADGIMRREE